MRTLLRIFASSLVVAVFFVLPGRAAAGYGVQPDGQSLPVTVNSIGTVATPATLDFVVYLDGLDRDPYVWVSDSSQMDGYGLPLGRLVGSCAPYELIPFGEPGKWVCRESTILIQPGRTYYWWLDFRRLDTGDYAGQQRVSGPFSFTLVPQAPPVAPPSEVDTTSAVSTKTVLSAATLPSEDAFDGTVSVKHTTLTRLLYGTMKSLVTPRTLAIACWAQPDWESVLAAEGDQPSHGSSAVLGFWKPALPRWLHLAPATCSPVQELLDSGVATGKRAAALATVLHEAMHAYGIDGEARANCLAVQLVPFAGRKLGMSTTRAAYLGRLAVRYVRGHAPAGYWSFTSCRDGGRWDTDPARPNLG